MNRNRLGQNNRPVLPPVVVVGLENDIAEFTIFMQQFQANPIAIAPDPNVPSRGQS